jgi:hypothetical protein
MKLARRVYWWAGVYGLVVLLPMYFLEERIGRDLPPAITHPENYYGFLAVTVAWQVMYLMISTDPARYRPLMPVTILAKVGYFTTLLVLFLLGRVAGVTLGVTSADLILGVLFALAYARTPKVSFRSESL